MNNKMSTEYTLNNKFNIHKPAISLESLPYHELSTTHLSSSTKKFENSTKMSNSNNKYFHHIDSSDEIILDSIGESPFYILKYSKLINKYKRDNEVSFTEDIHSLFNSILQDFSNERDRLILTIKNLEKECEQKRIEFRDERRKNKNYNHKNSENDSNDMSKSYNINNTKNNGRFDCDKYLELMRSNDLLIKENEALKEANKYFLMKNNENIDNIANMKRQFSNLIDEVEVEIDRLNNENSNLKKEKREDKDLLNKYKGLKLDIKENRDKCNCLNFQKFSELMNCHEELKKKMEVFIAEKDSKLIFQKEQSIKAQNKLMEAIDKLEEDLKNARLANSNLHNLNSELETELAIIRKTNNLYEQHFNYSEKRILDIKQENEIVHDVNVSIYIYMIYKYRRRISKQYLNSTE
jgi:hypothetical protein